MIDKIKIGDVTHKIKDTSISEEYRIKTFKSANDYRRGEMTTDTYKSSTTSICLTNIVKLEKPTIFSVKDGYKYYVAPWAEDSDNGGLRYYPNLQGGEWTSNKLLFDKGQYLYVSIAKTDGTNIDVSEYENLLIEELEPFHYGEYNERDVISKLHFSITGHKSGFTQGLDINKQRCLGTEFLRFSHDVVVRNINSKFGFSIFTYNDEGTEFVADIAGTVSGLWAGTTTEYTVPANTTFRIYIRKLDNSDFSSLPHSLYDATSVIEIDVNTYDTLKAYIDSQIANATSN